MFKFWKKHTADGREVPDPTPISVDLSERPLTLAEQIARFSKATDFAAAMTARGLDTFDEADDFEVGQELDEKISPYEQEFHGVERPLARVQTRQDELKAGMVEEIPIDRQERAQERIRKATRPPEPPKKEEKPAA